MFSHLKTCEFKIQFWPFVYLLRTSSESETRKVLFVRFESLFMFHKVCYKQFYKHRYAFSNVETLFEIPLAV